MEITTQELLDELVEQDDQSTHNGKIIIRGDNYTNIASIFDLKHIEIIVFDNVNIIQQGVDCTGLKTPLQLNELHFNNCALTNQISSFFKNIITKELKILKSSSTDGFKSIIQNIDTKILLFENIVLQNLNFDQLNYNIQNLIFKNCSIQPLKYQPLATKQPIKQLLVDNCDNISNLLNLFNILKIQKVNIINIKTQQPIINEQTQIQELYIQNYQNLLNFEQFQQNQFIEIIQFENVNFINVNHINSNILNLYQNKTIIIKNCLSLHKLQQLNNYQYNKIFVQNTALQQTNQNLISTNQFQNLIQNNIIAPNFYSIILNNVKLDNLNFLEQCINAVYINIQNCDQLQYIDGFKFRDNLEFANIQSKYFGYLKYYKSSNNLITLRVQGVYNILDQKYTFNNLSFAENLNQIQELLICNTNFHHLSQLRCFPNIQVIKIVKCNELKKIRFKRVLNLRKLQIINSSVETIDFIQGAHNLQHIMIYYCSNFKQILNFKNICNLKQLYINNINVLQHIFTGKDSKSGAQNNQFLLLTELEEEQNQLQVSKCPNISTIFQQFNIHKLQYTNANQSYSQQLNLEFLQNSKNISIKNYNYIFSDGNLSLLSCSIQSICNTDQHNITQSLKNNQQFVKCLNIKNNNLTNLNFLQQLDRFEDIQITDCIKLNDIDGLFQLNTKFNTPFSITLKNSFVQYLKLTNQQISIEGFQSSNKITIGKIYKFDKFDIVQLILKHLQIQELDLENHFPKLKKLVLQNCDQINLENLDNICNLDYFEVIDCGIFNIYYKQLELKIIGDPDNELNVDFLKVFLAISSLSIDYNIESIDQFIQNFKQVKILNVQNNKLDTLNVENSIENLILNRCDQLNNIVINTNSCLKILCIDQIQVQNLDFLQNSIYLQKLELKNLEQLSNVDQLLKCPNIKSVIIHNMYLRQYLSVFLLNLHEIIIDDIIENVKNLHNIVFKQDIMKDHMKKQIIHQFNLKNKKQQLNMLKKALTEKIKILQQKNKEYLINQLLD